MMSSLPSTAWPSDMAVTKLEIAYALSDTTGLTVKTSKSLVDTFFDKISATLAAGEDVRLSGFGKFTLREKRARPGRNPRTGEPVEISARRVVTFHSSPKVKERC